MTDNGKLEGIAQQAVRERLAEAGAEAVEQMVQVLRDGLQVTKVVNADVQCKKCAHNFIARVSVPDAKAASVILESWLNQGFGRPGAAESPEEQRTTVNYSVLLHCEGCSCEEGSR